MASVSFRDVAKSFGHTKVIHGIGFDIADGEFTVLVGPSGCGKSTLLRMLAGLEEISGGTIAIDGKVVNDIESKDRDIAMVFQSYALYPHMTVAENIGFPLRMVGTSKEEIDHAVQEAAAKVHIGHLLDRRPGQLSGGQQQRVALARAIVRKPRLFLLDEPLSNLDAKLRLETRVELKKLQRSLDVTAVYVTHDQEEAMTIADRMAIFMEGRIAQVGTPDEVYSRPASVDVAAFIGSPPMNLLPARIDGTSVIVANTAIPLGRDLGPARSVTLGVRPGALRLGAQGVPARVYLVEHLGDSTVVNLQVEDVLVRLRTDRPPQLAEGQVVRLSFDAADAHLFDETTGRRL